MPTYEYKREDGTTFEIEQRITAPSLTICPTTGQKVKRIISSGAGLVFKGSGFYQTDYVRKADGSKPKSKSTDSSSTDSGTSANASEGSTTEKSSTDSKKDSSGSGKEG
mgnify:CR=1 FL=1